MVKDSRKVVFGFLLLPLLCTAFLRLSFPSHSSWRLQLSLWPGHTNLITRGSSGINGGEYMRFLMRRLVQGRAMRELNQNGVTCFSAIADTFCVTTSAVRIVTGRPVVYFSARKNLSYDESFHVRPYPSKDSFALKFTLPVKMVANASHVPECDVTHDVPAVVFSTGGFAGNFFHSMNDIIIPLFLTAGQFRSRVQFLVSDYRPDWFRKFGKIISHLSAYDIVVASSTYLPSVEKRVHCFPGAVIGNTYHNVLLCNGTKSPGGVTTPDFKSFLHESFSLRNVRVAPAVDKPILVLIARRKTRAMVNEDEVAALADEVGFRVELAPPWRIKKVPEFAELVNSCSVLMGVHGAGLTNMVFLPTDAVVVQVVPLGLEWPSRTYYGRRPAARFGHKYVEYKSTAEESTLYDKYPKDDPVLTNPWWVNGQGYNFTRKLYLDGQNVTIDIPRLRKTLQEAMELLPR